jgi:hypothetical protein
VLTYEISNVHYGGKEVDLHVAGTNMHRDGQGRESEAAR